MMNRKRFAWRDMTGPRLIPRSELRNRDCRGICRCQSGKMQRLADMARSVAAPIFVLVKVGAARRKVEKCDAGQQRQRSPRRNLAKNVPHRDHATFRLHLTLPFLTHKLRRRLLPGNCPARALDPATLIA